MRTGNLPVVHTALAISKPRRQTRWSVFLPVTTYIIFTIVPILYVDGSRIYPVVSLLEGPPQMEIVFFIRSAH